MSTVAERIVDLFRRESPPGVVSVYLFGSQAAGREHRESDVDLGVLFRHEVHPSPRERFEEQLRLVVSLAEAGNDIDLVILNDAPPLLGREIVTRGQRLFCADSEADHVFIRDVQLRAADLAPFLRRTRRLKLAAIAG